MRRRLTFILAAVGLASIVLVGAGVLALASVGARGQAEADVTDQLAAINQLSLGSPRDLKQFTDALQSSRQAFSFTLLVPVFVIDGDVLPVQRDRGAALPTEVVDGSLTAEQLDAYLTGQPVIISQRRAVVGLQRVSDVNFNPPLRPAANRDSEVSVGVLARREISALPRGVIGWFLGSSAVVLAGAVATARLLAGRFVRPIHQIEATTAAIAQGDLSARSPVSGDDELAQLALSVNSMAEQLDDSKQRDRQFLMSVSHDLRTPLTAISGYAEALVDQPTGTNSSGHGSTAAIGRVIGDHADRLERLVTELLDLARLDSNQFTFRVAPVDVRVVVGRAVAGMSSLADQAGIRLTYLGERNPSQDNLPLVIAVDPDRLVQIVENLVANAIRFADSTIEVGVGVAGPMVEILVLNDGPTIAPDDIPNLFDRLYVGQAASDSGRANTGLGLAIVKELTEAMNGEASATSSGASGKDLTTFSIRFPRSTGPKISR